MVMGVPSCKCKNIGLSAKIKCEWTFRCSSDVRCEVFQHKGTRPGSCTLIYANPIEHDKDAFTYTENSLIYKNGDSVELFITLVLLDEINPKKF